MNENDVKRFREAQIASKTPSRFLTGLDFKAESAPVSRPASNASMPPVPRHSFEMDQMGNVERELSRWMESPKDEIMRLG